MRIRFDPDFDGGAWPGPLAGGDAVAGEDWLGELGLAQRLEAMLGLDGPRPTLAERAAGVIPTLRATEGFWSESLAADPLSTALELLRWKDELIVSGWRPELPGAPPRIASLAGALAEAPAGLPERLVSIVAALVRRPIEIELIELTEPVDAYPKTWRDVFHALERRRVVVQAIEISSVTATGDLLAARSTELRPTGDGSLQLLRPYGPCQAAEETAAWIAARSDLEGTVLITRSPLLDQALHRFGLPTTGATSYDGGSSLLEILPLVIALGWDLPDPSQALELLSLPESPIPKRMRLGLIRALDEWPAVGSDAWEKAVFDGIESIDADGRDRVRDRFATIFTGAAPRDSRRYATEEISRRTQLVMSWLAARRSMLEGGKVDAWDAALAQCRALASLIDLVGQDYWADADVQRSLRLARRSAPPERTYLAEAGLASVASPGAVAGPARRVVWWRFDRNSAPTLRRVPLSREETQQLAALGVEQRDPGSEAIRAASRWRRPLELASEAVLLVCPTRDAIGEESYPHPLWDEIRSRLARDARDDVLVAQRAPRGPYPPIRPRTLLEAPAPQRNWQIAPPLIPRREQESNTSVETLLQCSLRWTIRYGAGLYGRPAPSGEVSPRVLGRMAHALLSEVLPQAASPEEANARASQWLQDHGPRRVASLFLPGRESHLARVRRILCRSAEALSRLLGAGRLDVHLTEERIVGRGLGRELLGIPDFILTPGPIIVDAKWGGVSRRRDALRNGTASQLAFYAHLAQQQPEFSASTPAVAFFVLEAGRILTTDAGLASPAERIHGPNHSDVWQALESAFGAAWGSVETGSLSAPGNPDENGEVSPDSDSISEDGRLVLAPPCRWCDYSGLCGTAFASETR